jgi:hypothetical protein
MRPLLLGVFLIFSTAIHAANTAKITQWSKHTLLNALSVHYNDTNSDDEQHSVGLTPTAWDTVHDFLEGYMPTIHDKKLIIHPTFLIDPTVVDSGIAAGIPFWRVNAELLLPEINTKVAFSLIILATNESAKEPYLIHSMKMVKQENP